MKGARYEIASKNTGWFVVKLIHLVYSLYFLCNEIFLLCDLHSFSELTSSRLFYNFLEFIIQQIFFSLIATFLIKAWAADAIFSDYSFTEWQLRFTNPCLIKNIYPFFYLKIDNFQFWPFLRSKQRNYAWNPWKYQNSSLFNGRKIT